MESILKDKQSVTATIDVTVDRETVDDTFRNIIATYAKKVKVPGFRPGKAPRGVVIKRVGLETITQEVREILIETSHPLAISKYDLRALHAHVDGDDPREGEAFIYELRVELYPEFDIPETSSIVIDTQIEAVTDEQVQATVENLRREHATQVPVDRAIEADDVVRVETVGENDERREGTSMPIDLSTTNRELGDQLLGKSIGDVFDLQLGSPAETDAEPGRQATSTRIYVADVKARELPDTDDAFAATLGFERWNDVLAAIRTTLEDQAKDRGREAQREEFVEKLMVATQVDLPTYLVRRREGTLLDSLTGDLKRQGMDLEGYLAKLDEDGKLEAFEAELQESAERGAKRDLILGRLLDRYPAEVSDAELNEAVRYMASREGKDVAAFLGERDQQWLDNYRFLLRRDKALRIAVGTLVGDVDVATATDIAPSDVEPVGASPDVSVDDLADIPADVPADDRAEMPAEEAPPQSAERHDT